MPPPPPPSPPAKVYKRKLNPSFLYPTRLPWYNYECVVARACEDHPSTAQGPHSLAAYALALYDCCCSKLYPELTAGVAPHLTLHSAFPTIVLAALFNFQTDRLPSTLTLPPWALALHHMILPLSPSTAATTTTAAADMLHAAVPPVAFQEALAKAAQTDIILGTLLRTQFCPKELVGRCRINRNRQRRLHVHTTRMNDPLDLLAQLRTRGLYIQAKVAEEWLTNRSQPQRPVIAITVYGGFFQTLQACATFDLSERDAIIDSAGPYERAYLPLSRTDDSCYLLADRAWYCALRVSWLSGFDRAVPVYPIVIKIFSYQEQEPWLTRYRRYQALYTVLAWIEPKASKYRTSGYLLPPNAKSFGVYCLLFRILGRWTVDGSGESIQRLAGAIYDAHFGPVEAPDNPRACTDVLDGLRSFLLLGCEHVVRVGVLRSVNDAFAANPALAVALPESYTCVRATLAAARYLQHPFEGFLHLVAPTDTADSGVPPLHALYRLCALPWRPDLPTLPHEVAQALFLALRPTPGGKVSHTRHRTKLGIARGIKLRRDLQAVLRSQIAGSVTTIANRPVWCPTRAADTDWQTLMQDALEPPTAHLYAQSAAAWLSMVEYVTLYKPRQWSPKNPHVNLLDAMLVTQFAGHQPLNLAHRVTGTPRREIPLTGPRIRGSPSASGHVSRNASIIVETPSDVLSDDTCFVLTAPTPEWTAALQTLPPLGVLEFTYVTLAEIFRTFMTDETTAKLPHSLNSANAVPDNSTRAAPNLSPSGSLQQGVKRVRPHSTAVGTESLSSPEAKRCRIEPHLTAHSTLTSDSNDGGKNNCSDEDTTIHVHHDFFTVVTS